MPRPAKSRIYPCLVGLAASGGWLAIGFQAPRLGAELSPVSIVLFGCLALSTAIGGFAAVRGWKIAVWCAILPNVLFGAYLLFGEGLSQLTGSLALAFVLTALPAAFARPDDAATD